MENHHAVTLPPADGHWGRLQFGALTIKAVTNILCPSLLRKGFHFFGVNISRSGIRLVLF